MEFINDAALAASTVVVFVTEALKHVPGVWTSRYPVVVNIVLSLIGALVVKGVPTFTSWFEFGVQWFVIAVVAGLAYNQLVKPAAQSSRAANVS